jgi:hypothetical protein
MSNLKRGTLLGVFALVSASCGQTPEPATAPTADSKAPVAAAAVAAPVAGLHAISADKLIEPRVNAPASCNIEAIGDTVFKNAPVKLPRASARVDGWFLSERSKASGLPATLRIEDESGTKGWELGLAGWAPRADVISAMHAVDQGNPGFHQALDLSGFAPGLYRLSVVFSDSGTDYACDNDRSIIVK